MAGASVPHGDGRHALGDGLKGVGRRVAPKLGGVDRGAGLSPAIRSPPSERQLS